VTLPPSSDSYGSIDPYELVRTVFIRFMTQLSVAVVLVGPNAAGIMVGVSLQTKMGPSKGT
jgi:hypothetical protein